MADINLVPEEIKVEQERTEVVKKTTVVALALAVLVALISGYFIFQTQSIKAQTVRVNSSIEDLRVDINQLSEIEVKARNLDVKSKTVEAVFSSRSYFSVLMTEFKKQIPENVVVDTFGTAKDNTVTVSGFGPDYLSISQFVNNLSDSDTGLFTDVSLNSVSLDSQTSKVKFFIILTVNQEKLQK